jgi:enoyl-[acyl-carrier-protein] reductase (NADH)
MSNTSQNQMVLEHLQKHRSITGWDAISKYHITRLAARIKNLKDSGHNIITVMEYAESRRWAKYTLMRSKKNGQ